MTEVLQNNQDEIRWYSILLEHKGVYNTITSPLWLQELLQHVKEHATRNYLFGKHEQPVDLRPWMVQLECSASTLEWSITFGCAIAVHYGSR